MEDITVLKKITFLKDLTTKEFIQINKITERKVFKAGDHLVNEGTVCDAFYIIKSGAVKVVKKRRQIAKLGAAEPLGEISFIDKGLRSATIIALENTIVLKIPSDPFEKLLAKEKDIAYKVYKAIAFILCRRLRETNEYL